MGGKLHIFSVYTDFGACKRVKWVVNSIAKLAGHRWQCSSEMWKLDSLIANEPMGRLLANDAANADMLIVVASSLEQRRPELMDWLATLAPLQPHRSGLLIGLLGDEEDKGEELDWTAKQLINLAQESNRKFIWHWMGHHEAGDSDWLADSVEALLAHKQSYLQAVMPVAVTPVLAERAA
jgi:hypothetical protein